MDFCADYHFLEGVRIITFVIKAFLFIIPSLLIVMGSYDFIKSVLSPEKEEIKTNAFKFGKRLASAVLIFLIPSIINIVFSMVSNFSNTTLILGDCMKNANKEYIAALKAYHQQLLEDNKKEQEEYDVTYDPNKHVNDPNSSSSTSINTNGDLLEIAQKSWQQIANGDYNYGGASIPISGSTVDCSSFVSWILYQYGYSDEFGGYQHITQQFVSTNWNEKFGWEEITVGAGEDVSSKLQPGDILVRDNGDNNGHMNITVEVTSDGKVMAYDCGSKSNWVNSGGNPVDKSKFAKSDSRSGKIIRITNSNNSSNNSQLNSTNSSNSSVGYSNSSNNIIFIGDSRMVGLCATVSGDYNKCQFANNGAFEYNQEIFISQGSMSYNWFANTAVPAVNQILKSNSSKKYTIISNMGVNMLLSDVDKYISKYKELSNGEWKDQNVIIVSVNPVDENKEAANGYSTKNSDIETFNQKTKDGISTFANFKYCDVYSQIKNNFNTTDGLHYDSNTYQSIYNKMKGCV